MPSFVRGKQNVLLFKWKLEGFISITNKCLITRLWLGRVKVTKKQKKTPQKFVSWWHFQVTWIAGRKRLNASECFIKQCLTFIWREPAAFFLSLSLSFQHGCLPQSRGRSLETAPHKSLKNDFSTKATTRPPCSGVTVKTAPRSDGGISAPLL